MDIQAVKMFAVNNFFILIDKMLQADISHGEYETYLPALKKNSARLKKRGNFATGSSARV